MTMDKQFKIIKINKKTAELEPINADNCNTCDTEGGCGIASLGRIFRRQNITYPVSSEYKVGDIITLNIATSTLFKHAFLLYLLPLICLVVAAFFASIVYPQQDIYQVIFGILGFVFGFIFSKYLLKQLG